MEHVAKLLLLQNNRRIAENSLKELLKDKVIDNDAHESMLEQIIIDFESQKQEICCASLSSSRPNILNSSIPPNCNKSSKIIEIIEPIVDSMKPKLPLISDKSPVVDLTNGPDKQGTVK